MVQPKAPAAGEVRVEDVWQKRISPGALRAARLRVRDWGPIYKTPSPVDSFEAGVQVRYDLRLVSVLSEPGKAEEQSEVADHGNAEADCPDHAVTIRSAFGARC